MLCYVGVHTVLRKQGEVQGQQGPPELRGYWKCSVTSSDRHTRHRHTGGYRALDSVARVTEEPAVTLHFNLNSHLWLVAAT